MSALNNSEKTETGLLGSAIPGRTHAINRRLLQVALIFLVSLILGIFLGNLVIKNISLAFLLITVLLVMVITSTSPGPGYFFSLPPL